MTICRRCIEPTFRENLLVPSSELLWNSGNQSQDQNRNTVYVHRQGTKPVPGRVFTDPVSVNSRACSRIFLAKLVKNCPPPPILSQMNATQTLPPALTLSSHLRLHNDPFACGLPTEILYAFLMSPMQEKPLLTGMNERGHIIARRTSRQIAWHSVPYSEATAFKPLHRQS